jgi:3-deoxy-alpha-D-manno-octulosonate 8-oxidase
MVLKYQKNLCKDLEPKQIELMIDIALSLVPLWENALGEEWETIMTRDRLRSLYQKM